MFALLKNAFQAKDIRNRIFFTLGMLIVFRLGTHITVPGVDAGAIANLASTGLFSLLDTFGGGALSQYSIFAMGVSPYITSSIVVQLLQMDIVPKFVEWSKQGEVGRRKLNQVTRYLTVILAFVQSVGLSIGFNQLSAFGLVNDPDDNLYDHRVSDDGRFDACCFYRRIDFNAWDRKRNLIDHFLWYHRKNPFRSLHLL